MKQRNLSPAVNRSCLLAMTVLLVAATPGLAQIGYPGGGYPGGGYPGGGYPGGGYPGGGYPGGGYPGGYPGGGGTGLPIPGRGRNNRKDTQKDTQPLASISGMLRKLDDSAMVVQADDSRIISLKRTSKTRFQKNTRDMKPADLKPGDHLRIEANQDDQGFYYAVNVYFEKPGTDAERAAASQPLEAGVSTSNGKDDDDRPVLRRKNSAADSDGGAAMPASNSHSDDPDVPVLRRKDTAPKPDSSSARTPEAPRSVEPADRDQDEPAASRSSRSDTTASTSQPPQDDSDRPKLRRGWSKERKPGNNDDDLPAVASARPVGKSQPTQRNSRDDDDADGRPSLRDAAPLPPGDPVIQKARAAAAEFIEGLPNYVCEEQMARFVNTTHPVSWQPIDVISTEVVYEKGQERYRNVKVNGKPTRKSLEDLGGSWSTGEFASVLADLFSPATAADFVYRRESTAAGQSALVYDFSVEQQNSHWHIQVPSQTVIPAYKGSVWIDKRTSRVLRIEMQSRRMPGEFPLDKVESAVDYEYVRLGGVEQYLLPVHSESLSCQRGSNNCSRNSIDFRNYHKYTADSEVTFTNQK